MLAFLFHIQSFSFDNTFSKFATVTIVFDYCLLTNSPTAKLNIAGNIKIADGTQGAEKVLISDADGLATWSNSTCTAPYYHFASTVFNQ
ncbi:hypothetical protein FIA58_020855 [Flavobacterium jejuense]|uniref:Uncharacterized protein n=1 Tax=Flavobacterium jejuense TaxID=1544455 RepID=A0ABX0IY13_9FLAO|nr:hypothetical protein [Flavobacterium jejuense]NHN28135.1 hypothetical protein [Flavobacterium jejuense]